MTSPRAEEDRIVSGTIDVYLLTLFSSDVVIMPDKDYRSKSSKYFDPIGDVITNFELNILGSLYRFTRDIFRRFNFVNQPDASRDLEEGI